MATKAADESGLQVKEDRDWQEAFWTAQRFAWLVLALFILAAAAGLTGKGGPFAVATARTPAGEIQYPRIARWQASEQVIVRLAPSQAGQVDLVVSPEFADAFSIDSVVPQPAQAQTIGEGHRFTFDVGAGGGDKAIIFNLTAGKPALARSVAVRIGDAPPARLTVTVLP